jgi:hypothetical protein
VDRQWPRERLGEEDRLRGEPQLRSETRGQCRIAERLLREGNDVELDVVGCGSHEVVEQRTGAIESRQQHDPTHLNAPVREAPL